MLSIGRLKKRKTVKISDEEFSDGYDAVMKADAKKYTIVQNITVTIVWDGERHEEKFSEAWHSGRRMIVDSFLVPSWYRIGTKGFMHVRAVAWAIPRHVSFVSLGMKAGRLGVDTWGQAHGREAHTPIASGTPVLQRIVKIHWDNKNKLYMDEYKGGKDLGVRSKRRGYVIK